MVNPRWIYISTLGQPITSSCNKKKWFDLKKQELVFPSRADHNPIGIVPISLQSYRCLRKYTLILCRGQIYYFITIQYLPLLLHNIIILKYNNNFQSIET